MKHHIKDGDRLIATIETHGDAIIVVHEPQKEIKPVQFADDRDTYVECTPEQRAEIIRVAKECGRKIFSDAETYGDKFPNLCWDSSSNDLIATAATREAHPERLWLPFDEFVARLKGEWVEPTEESAQRDYSHLVGKWVKCVSDSLYDLYGKWFKISYMDGFGDPYLAHCHLLTGKMVGVKGYPFFKSSFDFSNPLDYNPDEVERIIPFDVERWRSGDFVRVQTRDGRLPDKFNEVEQLKEYDCILTPLVGIIKGHTGVSCWGYNGKYGNLSEEHSHDLVLVVKGEGGGK